MFSAQTKHKTDLIINMNNNNNNTEPTEMPMKRSFSCPDMATLATMVAAMSSNNYRNENTQHRTAGFQRRHSWNGSEAWLRCLELRGEENDGKTSAADATDDKSFGGKYKRYLQKAGVAVVGGTMMVGGIILIPLPGPGIVLMGAGASVLATEFPAAQRAMEGTKKYCVDATEKLNKHMNGKKKKTAGDGAKDDESSSSTSSGAGSGSLSSSKLMKKSLKSIALATVSLQSLFVSTRAFLAFHY